MEIQCEEPSNSQEKSEVGAGWAVSPKFTMEPLAISVRHPALHSILSKQWANKPLCWLGCPLLFCLHRTLQVALQPGSLSIIKEVVGSHERPYEERK